MKITNKLLTALTEHGIEVEVLESDPLVIFTKKVDDELNPYYSVSISDYDDENKTYKDILRNLKESCEEELARIENVLCFLPLSYETEECITHDQYETDCILSACKEQQYCKDFFAELCAIVRKCAHI